MIYEAKVNELAQEFGVHRNTIRNWINTGILPAREGPGRRYLIQWEDYRRLCDKYGREPRIKPDPAAPGKSTTVPRSSATAAGHNRSKAILPQISVLRFSNEFFCSRTLPARRA